MAGVFKMKIFLSYSTENYTYKDEMKKTLSKLANDGEITLWIDETKLNAGEEFTEVIQAEIKKSDIFLLLLSRDFWASEYIQTYELPLILEQHKDKEAMNIPIILKDCYDITEYDVLKGINALPQEDSGKRELKPIDEFESKDRAYNIILKSIRMSINNYKKKDATVDNLKKIKDFHDNGLIEKEVYMKLQEEIVKKELGLEK